jgi:hypothetical protein
VHGTAVLICRAVTLGASKSISFKEKIAFGVQFKNTLKKGVKNKKKIA